MSRRASRSPTRSICACKGRMRALSIPLTRRSTATALRRAFLAAYRDTYGYTPDRCGRGRVAAPARPAAAPSTRRLPARLKTADSRRSTASSATAGLLRPDRWLDTPVVASRGARRSRCTGPLIIESADTTIVIPPGAAIARRARPAVSLRRLSEATSMSSHRPDHLRRHQVRARHHRRRHGLCRDAHGPLADRARRARLLGHALRPQGPHSLARPRPWRCISAPCRTRWMWCSSASPATSFPAM